MPNRNKIIVTGVIVCLAIMFCTVGRTRFRWLSDPDFWNLGEANPLRRMLFHKNGDIRRWGVIIFYILLLALVWLT